MNNKWFSQLAVVAALCLATFVAYANSFDVPFVFDDLVVIRDNPYLRIDEAGGPTLSEAMFKNGQGRPVAMLTFALNFFVGGEEVWGFHLVNLLVHVLTGVLVFYLAQFILPRLAPESAEPETEAKRVYWVALGAALLFVLHPIQTQAVTYVVQRMASMCACFYLASLLAYLQGRVALHASGRWSWWAVAAGIWLLALGTKEIAVTLPLAVLLCEWIVFQQGDRAWLRRQSRWLLLIALLMGGVAFVCKGPDFFKLFTRGYTKRDFTLVERLLTQGRVMIHYLSLIVLPLPSRLTLVYDFPRSTGLFTPPGTILCWGMILIGVIGAFLNAARYRLLSLVILWFFLHLAVESTILPLEMVYEHRVYLPLVMVCVGVSALICRLSPTPAVSVGVTAGLCLLLGLGTHERNDTWRSVAGLWRDNIAKAPGEPRGYYNLAVLRLEDEDAAGAMGLLNQALERGPKFHRAWVERGVLHARNRDFPAALRDFDQALAIPLNEAIGFGDYAIAYTRRGAIKRRGGDFEGAVADFDAAIDVNPAYGRAYLERGMARVFMRQPQAAIDDFLGAIHYEPELADAYSRLAWFLATYPDESFAQPNEAIKHATRACELTAWKDASRLGTLAAAYARAGRFDEAIKWQKQCLALTPPPRQAAAQQRLQLYEAGRPLIINYGNE